MKSKSKTMSITHHSKSAGWGGFSAATLGAVAAVCLFTLPARAASTDTWLGNTSANFSASANWTFSSGSGPVASGDSLVFGAAGTGGTLLTNDITGTPIFTAITFNTGAGIFSIGGNSFTLGTSTAATSLTLNGTTINNSTNIFSNNIQLGNAAQTINVVGSTNNLLLGGVISGAGSISALTKSGAGGLILANANTYAGGTLISGGTVYAGNNGALGAPSAGNGVTLNASTLYLNDGVTIAGQNLLHTGNTSTLDKNTGYGTSTWAGNIVYAVNGGSGEYIKNDNFGVLAIGADATTYITNNGSAIVMFRSGGNVTINSKITGSGNGGNGYMRIFAANNLLTINSTNNDFNGDVNIWQDTYVKVMSLAPQGTVSSLGTNGVIRFGDSGNAGNLTYIGSGSAQTDRPLDLRGSTGGATLDQSGTNGVLLFNGIFTSSGVGNKTLTLQGSTAGSGEIDSIIVDDITGTNHNALFKQGTGTWTLGGTNTYSGVTTVNGGTLLVNGAIGTNTVTVNNNGNFGGWGAVGGVVSYLSGSSGVFTNGNSMTFSNSLIIATSGTIPDVNLLLSSNVPAGSYTLATYKLAGSSGNFASVPVMVSGSLAPHATALVTNGNGVVVLVVTAHTFNTATVLTSSGNPSPFGSPVTFTATVQTNGVTAADALSNYVFKVDGIAVATNAVSGGQATYTTSSLGTGSHTVAAVYSGDGVYLPGTNSLTQIVTSNPIKTVMLLGANINPSTYGQYVTFTATVQTTNGITVAAATSNVVFKVDGSTAATVAVSGGQAVFVSSALGVGSHTVAAAYSGDVNYLPSTNSLTQTVYATTVTNVPAPGYYWTMDDTNNNGTYANSGSISGSTLQAYDATIQIAGRIGYGSLEIKRAAARAYASGVNLATNCTISFWVSPGSMAYSATNSNGTVDSQIINLGGTSSSSDKLVISFGANSNAIAGKMQVTVWDSAHANSVMVTSSQPMLMNRWTHVAVTLDSVADQLILYLNGVPNASAPLPAIFTPAANGYYMGLGNRYDGSVMNGTQASYFSGIIDDLKMWPNTVLNPAQVLTVAGVKPRPDYWWKFDQDMKDFTGYQDMVVTGDATNFIQGQVGFGAVALDGATYLEAPMVSLGQSGNYTLSLWCYPSNYLGGQYSLLTKQDSANQVRMYIDGSQGNKLCVQIYAANGTYVNLYSSTAIPLNTWTCVALTVSAGYAAQLYVNGVADNSVALTFVPLVGIADALRLGADAGGANLFAGNLDDVRVYRDKVLPPSEIALSANPPELFVQSPTSVQYGRYFQSERRLYEYEPKFMPSDPVSFDSMNRPYILGPGFVQTLNSSNQWVRLDLTSFIKAKYPTWDGVGYVGGGLLGDNFDGRIVFDDNDWAYMHVNTQGRTSTSPLNGFDLILYSTNYCRTWQMITVTNVYEVRWETRGLHSDHSRPPLMLGCVGYTGPTTLSLYEFAKNGTSLSLSKITLIEPNSPGIYNHSGSPRNIITVSNQTHIIWSRMDLVATNISIYAATLNRLTGVWNLGSSPSGGVNGTYVGLAGNSWDGHNVGALEVDSKGYLHMVIMGHDYWEVKYYHSTQPNQTTNWDPMVEVSTNLNNINTYPSLVCDASDNLHLMNRFGQSYVFYMGWYTKPAGQPWSNPTYVAQVTDDNYAVWDHKAEVDRLGNVYFNYNANYESLDLSCYDDYVREWPEDGLQNQVPPGGPPPARVGYLGAVQAQRGPTLRVLPASSTNWLLATTANFVANEISPPLTFGNVSGGTVTLSWNVPAFKLQSTTNLATGVWTDYPGGGTSPVIVPMNQAQQFFRLTPK